MMPGNIPNDLSHGSTPSATTTDDPQQQQTVSEGQRPDKRQRRDESAPAPTTVSPFSKIISDFNTR